MYDQKFYQNHCEILGMFLLLIPRASLKDAQIRFKDTFFSQNFYNKLLWLRMSIYLLFLSLNIIKVKVRLFDCLFVMFSLKNCRMDLNKTWAKISKICSKNDKMTSNVSLFLMYGKVDKWGKWRIWRGGLDF